MGRVVSIVGKVEKMVLTSIFSFSNIVYGGRLSQSRQKSGSFRKGFIFYQMVEPYTDQWKRLQKTNWKLLKWKSLSLMRQKTLWVKEIKWFSPGVFSLSHFFPSKMFLSGSSWFWFVRIVWYRINSLPNDKVLDWSILKAFAYDKISVPSNLKFVLGRVENIVGKGENAGYQHFLLFPQCFQNASFSGSLKVGIVWYRIKESSCLGKEKNSIHR